MAVKPYRLASSIQSLGEEIRLRPVTELELLAVGQLGTLALNKLISRGIEVLAPHNRSVSEKALAAHNSAVSQLASLIASGFVPKHRKYRLKRRSVGKSAEAVL